MNSFPIPLPGTGTVDVALWAHPDQIEAAAQQQLRNLAALPWTHRVAVMPDVHFGKGATAGSVIALRDAVAPAAVGVDIGCGMTAVRASLTENDLPDDLHPLRVAIERAVPVGFNGHRHTAHDTIRDPALAAAATAHLDRFAELRAPKIAERADTAAHQCGTLGGGNHFIEVTADDVGRIWLMLHSGSRNIDNELALRHIETVRTLEHNLGLPDRDLAVFLAGTAEMDDYLHDLYWAQEYARLNRAVMMHLVTDVVSAAFPHVAYDETVSCHHNYVSEEIYEGVPVIVTRKGAIRAGKGELGLIPGSMGTGSYVVRGLGNVAAMNSASHGAGRRMSRNKARKMFTVADLAAQTAGVECRKDSGVLDEIPGCYKGSRRRDRGPDQRPRPARRGRDAATDAAVRQGLAAETGTPRRSVPRRGPAGRRAWRGGQASASVRPIVDSSSYGGMLVPPEAIASRAEARLAIALVRINGSWPSISVRNSSTYSLTLQPPSMLCTRAVRMAIADCMPGAGA